MRTLLPVALAATLLLSSTLAPATRAESAAPSELTTPSVISIPITLSLNRLFGKLRETTPKGEQKLDRWQEMPPGSGHYVKYAWRREPLDMQLKGLEFSASTRLHYKLKYGLPKSSFIPFSRSSKIKNLAQLGFGGSEPRMDIRFVSRLRFGEDFRLHTETRIEPKLVDAVRVPMLGFDLSGWVSKILAGRLAAKAGELDREVPKRADLRPLAVKAWRRLSRPLPLMGRKAWLVVNPEGFAISPLEVAGDGVTIRLQLRARPEVVLTEPATPSIESLPPLTAADAPPGFRLGLNAELPFDAATRTLRKLLVGGELGLGFVKLGVKDALVKGDGGRVRMIVDVTGAVAGRLELLGTPRLDPESGDLTVPDFEYALESQGVLGRLGNWAAQSRLRDELRRRARWNVGATLRSLRRSSQEALDRPLGKELRMSGALSGLTVDSVTTDEQRIRAHLTLSGDVRITGVESP